MSLTKPNKMDDLYFNLKVYQEFLADPKLRIHSEPVKYFMELIEKNIKLIKKLEKTK